MSPGQPSEREKCWLAGLTGGPQLLEHSANRNFVKNMIIHGQDLSHVQHVYLKPRDIGDIFSLSW